MQTPSTQNPDFRHFIVLFVFSCLLLGGFAHVLYRQSQVIENRNTWVVHSYEIIRQTRRIMVHILDLETGQRGYLLTKMESFLTPYKEATRRIKTELVDIKVSVADNPEQLENIKAMEKGVDRLMVVLNGQLARFRRSGITGLTTEDIKASRRAMENVRNGYDKILELEQQLLDSRLMHARDEQKQYFYMIFFGTVLAIGGLIVANSIILSLLRKSRRTEKILAEFEERYRLVLQGVDDGIFDYDIENGKVFYSPSYKRLLGYSELEMPPIIDTFRALVHPEDAEAVEVMTQQYFNKEIPQFFTTFRMRHKDGSYRFILARGIAQWDASGRVRRMVGTHTDITAEKEAEQKLRELNEELESFTLIASHDLRAPLVNIKGFAGEVEHSLKELAPMIEKALPHISAAERQKLQAALHKDIPESLEFIGSAVEKMDMLTSAILDLSRIGRRKYSLQKIAVEDTVKRCLDSLAYEITQRNIMVHREPLPEVEADPLALEQIFGNILDNAIKYLDNSRPGIISISSRKLPGETLFMIEDNGRGIAEGDKSRVFDIFRRASNSGDVRGSGMGMAYIKAALRRIGGRIWFDSSLGKGTRFYFTLPNVPNPEQIV